MPTREYRLKKELKEHPDYVSPVQGKKISKDAANLLLTAFGYPTTAVKVSTPTKVNRLDRG